MCSRSWLYARLTWLNLNGSIRDWRLAATESPCTNPSAESRTEVPRTASIVYSLLRCLDEAFRLEALLAGEVRESIVEIVGDMGLARQNPEILSLGIAHDGPLISWIEADHPIVATERAEESNFQFAVGTFGIGEAGEAFDGFEVVLGVVAIVLHCDFAVGAEGVGGSGVGHTLLFEHVRITSVLEPLAGVAIQIEIGDGLHWVLVFGESEAGE